MKKFALPLAFVFAAGWAAAQQTETKAPEASKAEKAEKAVAIAKKYHPVDAEVVSTDLEKMTITVKVDGAEKTAPVSSMAKIRLSKVKAGDKVILSCKDVDGQHKEVVAIRAKAAAPAEK